MTPMSFGAHCPWCGGSLTGYSWSRFSFAEAVVATLADFRELLEGASVLSSDREVGLFGELTVVDLPGLHAERGAGDRGLARAERRRA